MNSLCGTVEGSAATFRDRHLIRRCTSQALVVTREGATENEICVAPEQAFSIVRH